MEVSHEIFNYFIQWLKEDGLKPRKSERLWKKTIFARLKNGDIKTVQNWEDFILEYKNKKVEEKAPQNFDENCMKGIGVNVTGNHKSISHVVKSETTSRIFFEEGGDLDVNNEVLLQILNAYQSSQK